MKKIAFLLFALALIPFLITGQTFEIDKAHTFIRFSIERFGAVDVVGRFNDFSGTLKFNAEDKIVSSANLSIDVNSIDTGHEERDGHLKLPVWLDAVTHGTIKFETSSISKSEDGFIAHGDLTIHGVTNSVDLPFKMTGPATDPTKTTAIGISATLMINRQDYGITFSKLMDNGKLFIGNNVELSINALAIRKNGSSQ